MLFNLLQNRLLLLLRTMVRSGETTERALARRLRVSQPHMHNILKGARTPSVDFCDHVICELEIPIERLLDSSDLQRIRRPALPLLTPRTML